LLDKKDKEIKNKGKTIKMLAKLQKSDTLDLQESLFKMLNALKVK